MIRLIAAPPDAVLAGGTIDAQKGYPTADDTSEGLAHLTAHQSLSEVPLTIYRVRRDTTWWVIVPNGTTCPRLPSRASSGPAGASVQDTLAAVAADRRELEKGHVPCRHGHYFYCGHCGPLATEPNKP